MCKTEFYSKLRILRKPYSPSYWLFLCQNYIQLQLFMMSERTRHNYLLFSRNLIYLFLQKKLWLLPSNSAWHLRPIPFVMMWEGFSTLCTAYHWWLCLLVILPIWGKPCSPLWVLRPWLIFSNHVFTTSPRPSFWCFIWFGSCTVLSSSKPCSPRASCTCAISFHPLHCSPGGMV